jgi:hypothetical protein
MRRKERGPVLKSILELYTNGLYTDGSHLTLVRQAVSAHPG